MAFSTEKCVNIGDYVVIQRQNFTKLHRVSEKGLLMLGKDQLDIKAIVGQPVWTTYKMEPHSTGKRTFVLTIVDNAESISDQLIKNFSGGVDNRDIFDDGSSQQLSTEEIVNLRDSGMSGQEIVGQLIENSKTFKNKTEYSQVKYLKKKEKKYCEYVTVRFPSIRLIAQILYKQDPSKIMGLRMDTLSQILTEVGICSNGSYILYENGCQGLVASSILDCLDDSGLLMYVHPGNFPQKQAIMSMNFSKTRLESLLYVNIYSLLRKFYESREPINTELGENEKNSSPSIPEIDIQLHNASSSDTEEIRVDSEKCTSISNKRKCDELDEKEVKRARWEMETDKAVNILKSRKIDGLIIVSREHPCNICTTFLEFLAPSRPFVVFSLCREPLFELYLQLKSRKDVIRLRLTETFLRSHQILENRTHPDILMSGGGGYLLSGIFVRSEVKDC